MRGVLPPTTSVADVALVHGHHVCLTPPLRPMTHMAAAVHGSALTVTITQGPGGEGLQPLYDMLSRDLGGSTLVVAGGAAVGGAVFGQIIARAARQVGVVAVVVDGGIRDRELLAGEGIAVFARNEMTSGAVGLAHVSATGEEVTLGCTTVRQGDLILCDGGGAVCLPAEDAQRWLHQATALAAAEDVVLAKLADGTPLNVAYRMKRDEINRIRESAPLPAQS